MLPPAPPLSARRLLLDLISKGSPLNQIIRCRSIPKSHPPIVGEEKKRRNLTYASKTRDAEFVPKTQMQSSQDNTEAECRERYKVLQEWQPFQDEGSLRAGILSEDCQVRFVISKLGSLKSGSDAGGCTSTRCCCFWVAPSWGLAVEVSACDGGKRSSRSQNIVKHTKIFPPVADRYLESPMKGLC